MTIYSAALLLFFILDPLGNIPTFLTLLKPFSPQRQRIIIARELIIALFVLLLFLWCGAYILQLMHLQKESVSITGGIVLFVISLRMIFPPPEGHTVEVSQEDPLIVPLAIPMIAGPSGMAAVILMGSESPGRLWDWSISLFLAWLVTAITLFFSTFLLRLVGPRVLTATERLMGLLLMAISVQMCLDGLKFYLK